MKFTAAGDACIQRRLPETYDGFEKVKEFIEKGDARFFNFETTVNKDCYAANQSGGTWLRTSPEVLNDTKKFGFNMTTVCNNHSFDFGFDGLLQTVDYLDKSGYVHAGAGRNLSEAAAPKYIDLPDGRVALIACCTSFSPEAPAGYQSRRLPGRPGINTVGVKQTVMVSAEELEMIKSVAKKTGINAGRDIRRSEGYLQPLAEGYAELGDMVFKTGDVDKVESVTAASDVARIESMIEEAKFQADYVIVSVHSHQIEGGAKEIVPEFLKKFCRHLVDLGVHAVIGHGPHLLRPMEIYNGRPIFYSLGDFMLQLENVECAPEDFYIKQGLSSDENLYQLFKKRTHNFTKSLQSQKVMLEAVIPYFEFDGDKLTKIELLPIELGYE
ncbi:MAG: CapA family protein [Clostridia bacterium]|nr:CapA family protein [Clostridia bacterium]